MARGVNKVILVGYVGKDPVVKTAQNETKIANLSLATSEQWKDKQSGEKVEKTEWHNLTFFSKLADVVDAFVRKGSMLYVEGKLQTQKYQDKNTGVDKYVTKVIIDQIQMLNNKSDDSEAPKAASAPVDDFDDQDIPF